MVLVLLAFSVVGSGMLLKILITGQHQGTKDYLTQSVKTVKVQKPTSQYTKTYSGDSHLQFLQNFSIVLDKLTEPFTFFNFFGISKIDILRDKAATLEETSPTILILYILK